MGLTGIVDLLLDSAIFKDVLRRVEQGSSSTHISGLSGSQKSLFISGLFRHARSTIFVVTATQQDAESLSGDIATLIGPERVFVFPAVDVMPYEETPMSADLSAARAKALAALAGGMKCVVLAPARALGRRMVPVDLFGQAMFSIRVGEVRDLEALVRTLTRCGYEILGKVDGRGQASVRGGIIDVFPHDADRPVRIEFFGDEIESIRLFDPETQLSQEWLDEATIAPAREFLYDSGQLKRACTRIREELERVDGSVARSPSSAALMAHTRNQLRERVMHHLERFETGTYFDNDEQYLPFFYEERVTVADWAGDALFVVDEPIRLKEALAGYEADIRETYAALLEAAMVLPSQADLYMDAAEVGESVRRQQIVAMSLLARAADGDGSDRFEGILPAALDNIVAQTKQAEIFAGRLDDLIHEIKNFRKRQYRVVCVASTAERRARLAELFEEKGILPILNDRLQSVPEVGTVNLAEGELSSGFQCTDIKLLVLTEAEIYGRRKKRRRFAGVEEGARIASYTDLSPGDYVVHVNHGVGKYGGVQTLEVAGVQRDYLLVQYAGEDRVYVPTDQVALLQKYIGMEDSPPRLNKLGGTEWTRAKTRVRESVQDMAEDLLRLHAARESVKGYAFSPDTVWQQEFEDLFPYEETPDQWRSIVDVKHDMERPIPMDRLLCGDVGFGKTEVALRAAFKAAVDGKQVAVLVPTTILAQQHYATFSERFGGFPMEVAILSRFQSDAEQRRVIRGLKMGSVDVVVGTHRLLSQDVRFRDLGLVVVDEEQRFGVAQKERLKELRKEVDVLTLTATPIPRTLHMAMAGVRDMSLMETPPENRFPIRTYVVEKNESLVREVILREIDRNGQIYFVHNRVHDIEEVAARLSRLVPEASIGIAHGQMPEDRLEQVMLQFMAREFDILVCTVIIESGIDIPNVNTIIIDDAHNLGLAQLYQLRGRVGRTNRVAYAYLLFKRDAALSEIAEKRLAAIREFTSLGSGYKIAMRDLEIRGAGNILGPEQHGHIAAVGFEMYCRLLEETISELKGDRREPEPPPVVIDLTVDAYVPDSYVPDSRQKIEVYKKINGIESLEDASDLSKELIDRFGPLPLPVDNLIAIAALKVLARELGAVSIASERNGVVVRFADGVRYAYGDLMRIARPFTGRVAFAAGKTQRLRVKTHGMLEREILHTLMNILSEMRQSVAANQ
jgi:transcription-repair coupling factor (superfamily II helicase)